MIKPAYSVSFLLSINIFVWQNVLYFLDAPLMFVYMYVTAATGLQPNCSKEINNNNKILPLQALMAPTRTAVPPIMYVPPVAIPIHCLRALCTIVKKNLHYFPKQNSPARPCFQAAVETIRQELFVVMHVAYFKGYVDPVLEFWHILEVGCVADVSEEYSVSLYWVKVI